MTVTPNWFMWVFLGYGKKKNEEIRETKPSWGGKKKSARASAVSYRGRHSAAAKIAPRSKSSRKKELEASSGGEIFDLMTGRLTIIEN